jgi:hypothetical protein
MKNAQTIIITIYIIVSDLLASTLSRALVTPSRLSKNSSVYIFSVSGPTLFSWDWMLNEGFITLAAFAAVLDFGFCQKGGR